MSALSSSYRQAESSFHIGRTGSVLPFLRLYTPATPPHALLSFTDPIRLCIPWRRLLTFGPLSFSLMFLSSRMNGLHIRWKLTRFFFVLKRNLFSSHSLCTCLCVNVRIMRSRVLLCVTYIITTITHHHHSSIINHHHHPLQQTC